VPAKDTQASSNEASKVPGKEGAKEQENKALESGEWKGSRREQYLESTLVDDVAGFQIQYILIRVNDANCDAWSYEIQTQYPDQVCECRDGSIFPGPQF
jgi:hypothetical protein